MRDDDLNLLERHADGELTHAEQERVAELLARPESLEEAARIQDLRRTLYSRLRREVTPPALCHCICDCIRAEPGRRPYNWSTFASGLALLGAAAAWLLFVSPGYFLTNATQPGAAQAALVAIPVTADQFATVFQHCACGTGHDGAALAGMPPSCAAARVCELSHVHAAVPDLSAAGYRLQGVCLCWPSSDVRVVHAHYRSDKGAAPLSVFTADRRVLLKSCNKRECAKSKRTYQESATQDVNVVAWDENDRSVAVCGRQPLAELESLADSVRVAQRSLPASPVARR